jgi:hypothetical protein
MTALSWPIQTGGMPIVAWWPNLVVIFELTMLFAILATVGTLLVAGPLLRPRRHFHDAEIYDGLILVGVDGDPVPRADVERALLEVEGARLKSGGNP